MCKIHNETWLYTFTTNNTNASLETTYSYQDTTFIPYSIKDNTLNMFCYDKKTDIPESGILTPTKQNFPTLIWSSYTKKSNGLQALKLSIQKASENHLMFFLTIALFSICLICIITRWKIILHGLEIDIGWKKITSIFMIGQFFNFFMIGATGGDIVKAVYIARETHTKKTEVITSVFIDRFIGLFGLVSLTATILLVNYKFYMQFPETKYIFIFVQTAFVAFLFIILCVIFAKPLIDWVIDKLPGKNKFIAMVDTIYEAIRFCFTNKSVAIKTLILSYINHITAIFMMLFAGKALGVEIPNQAYFLIAPLINAIGSIPVTPGGLGMREIAAITFFGLLNVSVPSAFFLSFITYFAGMVWSLPGAVIYLRNNNG